MTTSPEMIRALPPALTPAPSSMTTQRRWMLTLIGFVIVASLLEISMGSGLALKIHSPSSCRFICIPTANSIAGPLVRSSFT